MSHTSYIYQINQKQTNYHRFQYQSNFINIWCYILPTFIKSIKNKRNIINFNINQISLIFDVTYFLHLSNQSNQSKTNKSSSIWISIKFHQYLMLHTLYIYQINQIKQKQTNHHQFEYQSNFINIWYYIQSTFINSIKSIKNKQIIVNFNINQIS
jgi:hypothetical protein